MKLAILGSTGSIGCQTLDVVRANPEMFEVYAITANNNADLLITQAKEFLPDCVVIANKELYHTVVEALKNLPIKVYTGEDSIAQVAAMESVDTVVTAMVGYSGLKPTIAAVKAGKRIALANKETLVVAGELITQLVLDHKAKVIPVDSEHGAIFQCLIGEDEKSVEKIILTASGGPFRTMDLDKLHKVTAKDALKHPTWNMGAKITIDSASLMNKGFEVIEAKWLFGLSDNEIDVIVHPQSIIHSLVQFKDGSIKAQMGLPDMRLPIHYALHYPSRVYNDFERFDFMKYPKLTFEQPDTNRFKNLTLAYHAMQQGGNIPCILNAANEVVVEAFLKNKIGFMQMSDIIEKAMNKCSFIKNPTYEDYVLCDKEAREFAKREF